MREYTVRPQGIPLHINIEIREDRLRIVSAVDINEEAPDAVPGKEYAEALAGRFLFVNAPYTLTLDEFRHRREFKDVCCWGVCFNKESGGVSGLINIYAQSYSPRLEHGQFQLLHPVMPLVYILVPHTGADFSEMGIRIVCPSLDSVLISNESFTSLPRENFNSEPMLWMPALEVVGPDEMAADSVEEFMVTATRFGQPFNAPLQVELENVNGYLPVTRLDVAGGATFKASSLHLERGHVMKIKAGFRYRPGVAEIKVRIK